MLGSFNDFSRPLALLATPLALWLTGCNVGPDFKPPAEPVETNYELTGPADLTNPPGESEQHLAVGEAIAGDWWSLYRSPALDQILALAIAENRDLAVARANLAAAHEAANAARGGLFPQIDFAASAERQRLSYAAFGLNQPPAQFNIFQVGPSVSYSLDVFGRTRRLVEERDAQAKIQEYQLDATYLSLTGNTVAGALLLASLDAQVKAMQDIVAADQDMLGLTQKQTEAGAATRLDIESARSQLAADRALLPPLQHQQSVARHALALLVGKSPAQWTPPAFTLDSLILPAHVPVTLPSKLVHQRPDILAAEAELHAATAAVGVATAELYPDISLTGSISQIAVSPSSLFQPASTIWAVAAAVSGPLFHGGSLEAQKRAAGDNLDAAYATYQQTVLAAFAQVADALDALQSDADLLGGERQAMDSARISLDLTRRTYTAGAATLLQVLDSQRLYQRARLGYIRAAAQRHVDTAQLILAMGGGWWNKTDLVARDREPTKSPTH
jgi:NodT family efflux transporter outer membrane factor (OMF) lipoprotein